MQQRLKHKLQKWKENYALGYIKKVQSQDANGPRGEAEYIKC